MRFCFELAILIWQTLQHHEEEEDRLNDDAFGRVRQGCKVVCWQRSRSGRRRRERGFSNSGAHHPGADSSGTVDDVKEGNLEVRAEEGDRKSVV